jgi:hypothetical protein
MLKKVVGAIYPSSSKAPSNDGDRKKISGRGGVNAKKVDVVGDSSKRLGSEIPHHSSGENTDTRPLAAREASVALAQSPNSAQISAPDEHASVAAQFSTPPASNFDKLPPNSGKPVRSRTFGLGVPSGAEATRNSGAPSAVSTPPPEAAVADEFLKSAKPLDKAEAPIPHKYAELRHGRKFRQSGGEFVRTRGFGNQKAAESVRTRDFGDEEAVKGEVSTGEVTSDVSENSAPTAVGETASEAVGNSPIAGDATLPEEDTIPHGDSTDSVPAQPHGSDLEQVADDTIPLAESLIPQVPTPISPAKEAASVAEDGVPSVGGTTPPPSGIPIAGDGVVSPVNGAEESAQTRIIPFIGEQIGTISAFLIETKRRLVGMPTSANNDGFRAILSQIQTRYGKDDIDSLRAAIGMQGRGPFTSENMQKVADHYKRAVIVVTRNGEDIIRYEFAIPGISAPLVISDDPGIDLSTNFAEWLKVYAGIGQSGENQEDSAEENEELGNFLKSFGAHLPSSLSIASESIRRVLAGFLEETRSIVLVKGSARYMSARHI